MVQKPSACRNADCCYDLSGPKPEKIEGDVGILMVYIWVPMVLGIIGCIALTKLFAKFEDNGMKFPRAKQLFAQTFVVILWFGLTSWGINSYTNPCSDLDLWFNGENGVTLQTVVIGMVANVVFGFIDNAGLFFGGCYLDEVFALLPGSTDANVSAGYGNTFSDFLGSFLGTFVGLMLSDATGVSEGPLWANCLGIIVGCLIGIAVPKAILGNSSTTGLNRISARQVLLGSMEIDELEAIVDGNISLFDFRVERTFKKLDTDGSGEIDADELRSYMKDAMGDDFNEDQFQNDLKQVFQIHKDSNDQLVDKQEFRDIYKNMAVEALKQKRKEREESKSSNKKLGAVAPQQDVELQQNNNIQQGNSQQEPLTQKQQDIITEQQLQTPEKESAKILDNEQQNQQKTADQQDSNNVNQE